MLFQSGHHGVCLEMIIRRPDSPEAGFARDDLQENPAGTAPRAGRNHLHVFNRERGQTFRASAVILRCETG